MINLEARALRSRSLLMTSAGGPRFFLQSIKLLLKDLGLCSSIILLPLLLGAFVGGALQTVLLGVLKAVDDGLSGALLWFDVLFGEEVVDLVQ